MSSRSVFLAPSLAMFAVVAVFACGSTESSTTSNGSSTTTPESGTPDVNRSDAPAAVGATPAPDGNGVCCPLESPCSPGYRGGWAAKANECEYENSYDGSFDRVTDEHGCVEWISRGIQTGTDLCCGCIPPPDASTDADPDASDSG